MKKLLDYCARNWAVYLVLIVYISVCLFLVCDKLGLDLFGFTNPYVANQNVYSVGTVAFFKDVALSSGEVQPSDVALSIHSVVDVSDVMQTSLQDKGELNQYIGKLFMDDVNSSDYKYVVVSFTYANLQGDVCVVDYSKFLYMVDGTYVVGNGGNLDSLGSLYKFLDLRNVDKKFVFQGESVTGDIVLMLLRKDPNPILVYGDSLVRFNLK